MNTRKIASLLAFAGAIAAAALTQVGCGTPVQQAAQVGAGAGDVYAEYELGRSTNTQATINALSDLATNLPNIPLGTVSSYEQGVIQGELNSAKAGIPPGSDPKIANAIGSLIALATTAPAGSGLVTADMALASQQASNIAYGINRYIKYWQGLQAGQGGARTTPPAAPASPPTPTSYVDPQTKNLVVVYGGSIGTKEMNVSAMR